MSVRGFVFACVLIEDVFWCFFFARSWDAFLWSCYILFVALLNHVSVVDPSSSRGWTLSGAVSRLHGAIVSLLTYLSELP